MRPEFDADWGRSSSSKQVASEFRAHLRAVLNSYSEVLFIKGWGFGVAILAVSLLAPNQAIMGLVAVVAAYAFARFINMEPAFLDSGFYT